MIIIFDFDGTIADTTKYFLEMANEIAEDLNYPKITQKQFDAARGKRPRDTLKELQIPLRAVPRLRKASHRKFETRMDAIELIPGMKKHIEALSKEHTLGVLTSNDADLVLQVLRRFKVDGNFAFVNSAVSVFGKHRALNKIIKRNGYKKSDVIYIGDEVRDIEGAKKAGIQVAAVTWGFNTQSILEESKPDFLLSSPKEIVSLLDD